MANAAQAKKEGDISSAFVSLSGREAKPLDPKFVGIKQNLIAGREEAVIESFHRLLKQLKIEISQIKARGSDIIPSINYSEIQNAPESFSKAHKKHGVAIIRRAVPKEEALAMLKKTHSYIAANPTTKGYPPHHPAVWELYWSPAQIQARAHPDLLKAQSFLMSHWQNEDPNALLSTQHPIAYADRLRIRPPGDAGFALGPHVDGGSCERWEPTGYGLGNVYGKIFEGKWEEHNPFDGAARLPVASDLYQGAGACSAFRMYQGWLSMSETGPGEGTLLVNPLFNRATAYYLLRPFFTPKNPNPASAAFLDSNNWQFESETTSTLQGAYPGHGQELNAKLHPHLELETSMVSVPKVRPGDYIAWHCDTIHAVDAVHQGTTHSSVLYIPACPLTEETAKYLIRQRDTFFKGCFIPLSSVEQALIFSQVYLRLISLVVKVSPSMWDARVRNSSVKVTSCASRDRGLWGCELGM